VSRTDVYTGTTAFLHFASRWKLQLFSEGRNEYLCIGRVDWLIGNVTPVEKRISADGGIRLKTSSWKGKK
jgi:hypothetical protein